jgi:hypothetical protein
MPRTVADRLAVIIFPDQDQGSLDQPHAAAERIHITTGTTAGLAAAPRMLRTFAPPARRALNYPARKS